jgi:SprT protein
MKREPLLELLQRTEACTRELLTRAERHLERPMPQADIRFDLRGRSAGMVRFAPGRPPEIRYNPQLLAENEEQFLARTVPHEVAHLVVRELFGAAARPHGQEWRAVMGLFGADPSRCHDYDVSRSQTRRLPRFVYHCGCRRHELTSIRHRRVLNGQSYLCRACKQPLQPGAGADDRE